MQRRVLWLLLLSTALLAPLPVSAGTDYGSIRRSAWAAHDGAMLRLHPGLRAPVLATLVQQTEVEVLGTGRRWDHVLIWDSIHGWMEKHDLTSRRPFRTVSTYSAPEIHVPIRPQAPEVIRVRANALTTTPLYRVVGGAVGRRLAAGSSVTITAWQQDKAGAIWYRIGALWAAGEGISFVVPRAAHTRQNGPKWAAVAGKGMWLTLGIKGVESSVLIAAATRDGISHLYLEAAISPLGFHGRSSVGSVIDAAHRRHIAVIAWVYPYLSDVASDVNLTREVAAFRTPSGQRFDGIAADLERNIHPSTVRSYSQLVRAELGNSYLLVGVTYPPQSFAGYPYAEVARRYDVIAPMDYWHQTTSSNGLEYGHLPYGWEYGYRFATDSIESIRRAAGNTPVAPIGQTFDNFGRLEMGPNVPSAAEIRGFLSGCKNAGAIGASFFQWMTATRAEWHAIHRFHFKTVHEMRTAPARSGGTKWFAVRG